MKSNHSIFDWLLIGTTIFAAALVIAPILCVLLLSVYYQGGLTLEWYISALQGEAIGPMMNTITLAVLVGIIGTIIGGVFALNWWNVRCRELLIGFSFAVAALPGSLYAIGIIKLLQHCGVREASTTALVIAHIILVMPFCTALIMAGISYVKEGQVEAALELSGGKRRIVAWKIVLPLIWPSFLSAFVVGFLLSANEYVRTSYISGSTHYLSKYIYGKMGSGTDPSTYALGGINVLAAILAVVVIGISLRAIRKRSSV